MSEPAVRCDVAGSVLVITINRPHARNAVNRAVSEGIAAALDRLDATPEIVAAVLTGAGGTFCSGMDLKAFPDAGLPVGGTRGFGGVTGRPPEKPLIAAVEGYAVAGGFEIALAADLIVAADDAVFGLPEVKRGLIASAGGLVRLGLSLPYQAALRIALTGEPVDARELYRHGVVAKLTPPGAALEVALELGESIGAHAPLAVAASKRLVRAAAGWGDAGLFHMQDEAAVAVLASADALEGARAFTEKRLPVWRGC